MSENPSEKYIKEGARKVTAGDFVKVIGKSREIQNRFRMRGPLSRFVEDGRLLLAFVKDYWAGRYRKVPYGIIAAVVFVLLYIINPLDIMPDFLPLIGVVDDAAIMGASLMALERDLFKYRTWKQSETAQLPAPGETTPAES
jgi:uncharacterized membrane protein YkvA (DUF1232 family)